MTGVVILLVVVFGTGVFTNHFGSSHVYLFDVLTHHSQQGGIGEQILAFGGRISRERFLQVHIHLLLFEVALSGSDFYLGVAWHYIRKFIVSYS